MPRPPFHVNLIARTNGVGLDRDVDLVAEILEGAGHTVTRSHCRDIPLWHRWRKGLPRFEVNIFMERIFPRWTSHAAINILIPNQERFPKRHLGLLKKVDHVLCKSRHALEAFSRHHASCHFTSFTSRDLYDDSVTRDAGGILHLAGKSTLKGTATVLDLWRQHPEWPTLTLLQHAENAPDSVPENVTLRTDYIPTEELNKMMNSHRIHLCPSLSEGWGHYIVEAMACEALMITTDGPPMNELVNSERGILVTTGKEEPRHLGTNFHVEPEALAVAIEQALSSSQSDFGKNARAWFLENDHSFRESLPALLETFRA